MQTPKPNHPKVRWKCKTSEALPCTPSLCIVDKKLET